MKFGRIAGMFMAATLVIASGAQAQDEDMGDLTTKRPARKATAAEEESNDLGRAGVFLGFNVAYALDNFDGIGLDTDGSAAFGGHIGYRHNKWLATELQVERYNEFDAATGEVNGWAVGINERVYPLQGRFQPYALMGLNILDLETTNSAAANRNKTDDGPALRFGLGLDVYATNHLVVQADVSYMLGLDQVQDYDLVLFGLAFSYRP